MAHTIDTSSETSLVAEKIAQAVAILEELEIDCWLTFVRETSDGGDPVMPLLLETSLTWQSALILTRKDDRIAIVGTHDATVVEHQPEWRTVIGYVKSVREPLREVIDGINPNRIALNYSPDDVKADGLTHGMKLLLDEYLDEWKDRFVSAAPIIDKVRGRKSTAEVDRMCRAIKVTDEIFAAVESFAKIGTNEVEVSRFMQNEAHRRGLGLAWDSSACPFVNTGPQSMNGHAIPSVNLSIQPGNLFQLDFGVRREGYCSDMQRVWYVPNPGETKPPVEVQRAFDTVLKAIEAARRLLNSGVECWRVDEAARNVIIEAGYPEYDHATGHQVGRCAHDGGGVLGPKWPRYGNTPLHRVEAGEVYALELGIANVDGRGYLGLEEMVLVTETGADYLTTPQTSVRILTDS